MTDATDVALEKARDALWDFFCPAIRHTPEDDATYRDAAEAVVLAYLSARHASPDGLAERLDANAFVLEMATEKLPPGAQLSSDGPTLRNIAGLLRAAASLLGGGVPEGVVIERCNYEAVMHHLQADGALDRRMLCELLAARPPESGRE